MKVIRLSSLDELIKIREEWNQLVDAQPGLTVFQRMEWMESWWSVFGDSLDLYVLAVYDENGQLAGAGPWYCETISLAGWKIRGLFFIADQVSDYGQILAASGREGAVWQALLGYLQQTKGSWDYLALREIPEPGLVQLHGGLPKPFVLQVTKSSQTFRLPLKESWARFQESVNKRMIKKYIRQKRLLGDYRLRSYSGDAITANVLEQVVQINRLSPLVKRTGSIFLHPDYRRFHESLFKSSLKNNIRILMLDLGGVPAACHYSFFYKGVLSIYNCCFNENLGKLSIGLFMDLLNIETAYQEGVKAIDYMRGEYDFKKHYNSESHQNTDVVLFKNNLFRMAYALATFFFRNVRKAYAKVVVPCKLAFIAMGDFLKFGQNAIHRQGWQNLAIYLFRKISRRMLQWGEVFNMRVRIREMAACDLIRKPESVEVRELFVSDYEILEQMVGTRNLPVMMSRFWSGDWCWGILHGGRLAGYVWANSKEQIDQNLNIQVPLNHDEIYLYDGIIHEQYRGAGLMGVMLREVARDPKLKRWLYATGMVNPRNAAQIKTMKKLGFTITDKISRANVFLMGFQKSQQLVPVAECLEQDRQQPQLTKK
jgi:CelD/BcsL family acetyltransferase involved in cellulose biosynthesis/GNAT superfamily N-acetyltransferase